MFPDKESTARALAMHKQRLGDRWVKEREKENGSGFVAVKFQLKDASVFPACAPSRLPGLHHKLCSFSVALRIIKFASRIELSAFFIMLIPENGTEFVLRKRLRKFRSQRISIINNNYYNEYRGIYHSVFYEPKIYYLKSTEILYNLHLTSLEILRNVFGILRLGLFDKSFLHGSSGSEPQ